MKKKPIGKLEKLSFIVSLVSVIGLNDVNPYYSSLPQSQNYLKHEENSREIYKLKTAKRYSEYLENSKNYKISSMDWNSNKINEELSNLCREQDELELTHEFKFGESRENNRKLWNNIFGIPWLLSIGYIYYKMAKRLNGK